MHIETIHLVMTPEVKRVLTEWAADFEQSAKIAKDTDALEHANFFSALTTIGMITGSAVNADAINALRKNAEAKLNSKNDPLLSKLMPPAVIAQFAAEAKVVLDWLNAAEVKP